jgi:hypothetical protein
MFKQVPPTPKYEGFPRIHMTEINENIVLALLDYPINPVDFGTAIDQYLATLASEKVVVAMPTSDKAIELEGGFDVNKLKQTTGYWSNPHFKGLIFFSNNQVLSFIGNTLAQIAKQDLRVRIVKNLAELQRQYRNVMGIKDQEFVLPQELLERLPRFFMERY